MSKFFIIAPRFLKRASAGFANAMALYPFILFKDAKLCKNKVLVNHEKIHLKQQIEMLIIPFYLWYLFEYLIRRIQYKSHYLAYRHISFEREAYANEHELDYLKNRKFWAFTRYLQIKKGTK